MAKKIQLTIPEPCHENWNNMTPVDKGRFCGSCQKQIVDFSNMSDREVAQFFKNPSTGSVCGRFMQDQLNRDMEIPKKRIPWVKYFFQIALPAFLFSAKAKAQGAVKIIKADTLVIPELWQQSKTKNTTICSDMMVGKLAVAPSSRVEKLLASQDDLITIKGKVVDENNNPLLYASVSVKGTLLGVTTDTTGTFSLNIKSTKNDITLVVSSVGYGSTERKLRYADISKEEKIVLITMTRAWQGQVILAGMVATKKSKSRINSKVKSNPIPLISEIKDTIIKAFKIYPNPVTAGSNVTLEWKETEEGYYIAQILNQSGQVVFTKEIWIDAEARVLSLDLPAVSAGNYFIRVANKKSGKNSTEKIIIQ